jgi:hypothetical protein
MDNTLNPSMDRAREEDADVEIEQDQDMVKS